MGAGEFYAAFHFVRPRDHGVEGELLPRYKEIEASRKLPTFVPSEFRAALRKIFDPASTVPVPSNETAMPRRNVSLRASRRVHAAVAGKL